MSKKHYDANDDEGEQGFQRAQALIEQPYTLIKNDEREQTLYNSSNKHVFKKQRAQYLIKQKPKIKFGLLEMLPLTSRKKGDSQKYIKSISLHKSMFEQSQKHQTLMNQQRRTTKQQQKKKKALSIQDIIHSAIVKTKRNQIGQDLVIRTDQNVQILQLKATQCIGKPIFKKKTFGTTYQFLRQLAKYSSSSFLNSKYNSMLKSKFDRFQSKSEVSSKFETNKIKFDANMQSSNLNYVAQLTQDQYNLFLSVDTNTRGHQNWFYFVVTNNQPTNKQILINICNMKRRFPMIKHGQGVYKRSQNKQWEFIPQVTIEKTGKKKYKLSFLLKMSELQRVEVSLIPPYTYSDLLRQIQIFQTYNNTRVDTLTYSLAGLAIPLITITYGSPHLIHKNRKLYLITSRIHPSETCSSYIISALVKQLMKNQYIEFLKQNVIKIVPMVNPDGVVFGNFRTNYLGVDLNRSFHYNDQMIYPETVAIKQLGKKCKQQYGNNFISFIDLHGHSSQASSFIYGPQYTQGTENYLQCRIFAKIIDRASNYFRYDFSSFRLEEYKFNTARGYFFKKLKVPSYTIETSYSLYCPKDNSDKSQRRYERLGISEWEELGRSLACSIKINHECFFISQQQKQANKQQQVIEKSTKKKRIQSIHKIEQNPTFEKFVQDKSVFIKLKKEIIYQIKNQKPKKVQCNKEQESQSESDGQSIDEDISPEERQVLIKRLNSTRKGQTILPKIVKQPKVPIQEKQQKQEKELRESKDTIQTSPLGIPTLYVGTIKAAELGVLQKISSKFKNKRYNRPVNISQEYTDYLLRNITGVSSLKPQVVNFNPKMYKPNNMKASYQS